MYNYMNMNFVWIMSMIWLMNMMNMLGLCHDGRLRLRLVRVKAFPENRYFPEMLFSGKENVFMCLVAF